MIIIETCPECGADLECLQMATDPPIPVKKCTKCSWRLEGEREKVVRVPLIGDVLSGHMQKIVRCKDCKFAEKQVCCPEEYEYKCTLSEFEGLYDYHNKHWFCADGKRKDDYA